MLLTVKTLKLFPIITGRSPNSSRLPQPLFKRVVIMLVDALREDFVFGPSGRLFMPYTRHLVERGSSHSFVAKARPPTVTMPRIKVSCHCVRCHHNQNHFYCQVGFHIQGIFSGVFGVSIENRKYLLTINRN